MATKKVRFNLFRIQAHLPTQRQLFAGRTKESEIIRDAILSKPTVTHRKVTWHVANTLHGTSAHPEALAFALGKPSKRVTPTLDPESGDFCDVPFDHAPHVFAVVDLELEVLALQAGTSIGTSSEAVARVLKAILQSTEVVREHNCKIAIDPIPDPTEFLTAIRQAAALTRLSVTFTRPNAFDHGQFQHDVQTATNALEADKGTVIFAGDDLSREQAEDLVRQSSSIGQRVRAWIRTVRGGKPKQISMKSNTVVIDVEVPAENSVGNMESQTVQLIDGVMEDLKPTYSTVRHGE